MRALKKMKGKILRPPPCGDALRMTREGVHILSAPAHTTSIIPIKEAHRREADTLAVQGNL